MEYDIQTARKFKRAFYIDTSMKIFSLLPAVCSLALLLTACSKDDRFDAMAKAIEQQNKTIIDQQQALLDQQQKLIDQEINIGIMASQLANDEQLLKQLSDQSATPAAPVAADSKVDARKVEVVKLLTGFNARLSANIGYGAYADALSDLNSSLAQSLLDIKDQTFIDEVNRVLNLYNIAGDFWQRFESGGVAEITLSSTDRYKYSDVGVNFVDSYNPRPTDVKKFWLSASNEIEKMLEYNSTDLGRDGAPVVRLFGR